MDETELLKLGEKLVLQQKYKEAIQCYTTAIVNSSSITQLHDNDHWTELSILRFVE